jgi:hypothetical protein
MKGSLAVASALALILPAAARAGDVLLLQQALEPDRPGTAYVQLDRDRVVLVRALKQRDLEHTVEITLAGEPPSAVTVHCIDPAATRQLLDALRPGGPPILDVTARCKF